VSPADAPDHWNALVRAVSRAGAANADAAIRELLRMLCELMLAREASALLAGKTDDPRAAPIDGWVPMRPFFLEEPDEHARALVKQYLQQPERWASNEYTQVIVRQPGVPRVVLREEAVGDPSWETDASYEWMKLCGLTDRIVGAAPLGRDLELWLVVDRGGGSPPFDHEDKANLLRALELLLPVGRNLALSYGLATGASPLSPREHDVLRGLLGGRSEADLSDDLGLSRHTVHEYVGAVYRKFSVRGLHELLTLWLRPWDE
jgi:DNA-binding CsgD family transcriptional regulator